MNTKPDPIEGYILEPLIQTTGLYTAICARQMGLVVGDTIIGREVCGNEWDEAKLELLFIGKRICVWLVQRRADDCELWYSDEESANWSLNVRAWFKLIKTD